MDLRADGTIVVSTERIGNRLVVTLRGPLDLGTRDAMVSAVADGIGPGVAEIELDVHRVTFCDSSGLAAFVGLRRSAANEGKRLYLRNPSTQLARILDITGLTSLAEPPE
jgi:anti-sigma B factor antagonist